MKWQEGVAIAGALSGNPNIQKATEIPLKVKLAKNRTKQQNTTNVDAHHEGLTDTVNWYD